MPVIAAIRMLREKNPGLSRGGTASEHPFLAFYSEFRTRLCPIQPKKKKKRKMKTSPGSVQAGSITLWLCVLRCQES